MDNKKITVLTEDQLKKFQSIKNSNLQRGSQREESLEAPFPDPQGMLCLKLFMMIEVGFNSLVQVISGSHKVIPALFGLTVSEGEIRYLAQSSARWLSCVIFINFSTEFYKID